MPEITMNFQCNISLEIFNINRYFAFRQNQKIFFEKVLSTQSGEIIRFCISINNEEYCLLLSVTRSGSSKIYSHNQFFEPKNNYIIILSWLDETSMK